MINVVFVVAMSMFDIYEGFAYYYYYVWYILYIIREKFSLFIRFPVSIIINI